MLKVWNESSCGVSVLQMWFYLLPLSLWSCTKWKRVGSGQILETGNGKRNYAHPRDSASRDNWVTSLLPSTVYRIQTMLGVLSFQRCNNAAQQGDDRNMDRGSEWGPLDWILCQANIAIILMSTIPSPLPSCWLAAAVGQWTHYSKYVIYQIKVVFQATFYIWFETHGCGFICVGK